MRHIKVSLTRKVPQFLKYLSWSQVYRLELRHETLQVAATHGGTVCDGSLETLTPVVSLLENRHIMKRIINMTTCMIMYDVISAKNILSFKIVCKNIIYIYFHCSQTFFFD